MYGTFGHGFAELTPDGKIPRIDSALRPRERRRPGGQPGDRDGQVCGIEDPEVDGAVERASKFFGYYVDKGAIPYGEHEPWPYHENNARTRSLPYSSPCREVGRETQFFAKMCTAAYKNREYGHTGQGFSYLWGTLGANTGGPEATAAFVKECSWHLDLSRRCDGSFNYDGDEQYGGGKPETTPLRQDQLLRPEPHGLLCSRLSLPLKKLLITGREANPKTWLRKREVLTRSPPAASTSTARPRREQLVAAFSDWSPIVRGWAAEELARVPRRKRWCPDSSPWPKARMCMSLRGPARLSASSRASKRYRYWFACFLTRTAGCISRRPKPSRRWAVRPSRPFPTFSRRSSKPPSPSSRSSGPIPSSSLMGSWPSALFESGLTQSLKGTDRELLYPAIRALATNADGMASMRLKGFFENDLTVEDVQALAPNLRRRQNAQSGGQDVLQ